MFILSVGATFVDIKGYPFNYFDPKGRNVGKVEYVHGGVMRNVAADIARVGGSVTFLSLIDESSVSLGVKNQLIKDGVNVDYLKTTPDGLGTWLAIFDVTNDVFGSISKRPDLLPICQIIEEKGNEIFEKSDTIALDISDEKEMISAVIKEAKKYHRPVYAAVSNMTEALNNLELLNEVDCFVCNKQEAGILFNTDYENISNEDMLHIIKGKIENGPIKSLVVTLGKDGACYANEKESGLVTAEKTEVIDTTGAGDAFFAGMVYGLHQGKSLKEACQIGSLLAANTINSYDNVVGRIELDI